LVPCRRGLAALVRRLEVGFPTHFSGVWEHSSIVWSTQQVHLISADILVRESELEIPLVTQQHLAGS
jgi:hypothetical protein